MVEHLMLRTALILLLLLHGGIHFIGIEKAFGWADLQEISRPISRPMGLVWGTSMALLMFAALLNWARAGSWWAVALCGILISQVLIVQHWEDARFGTIANALILIAVVTGAARWNFRRAYKTAAAEVVSHTASLPDQILTAADARHLPEAIQHYLQASGAIGKSRPRNMKLKFAGELRYLGKPWMPFRAVQFNRFDIPERHFWLDATMKGMPVCGYHRYTEGKARMKIRAAGIMPVVDKKGEQMDQAETVTWFNDLCLFAPGALVDERVMWEELDPQRVRAIFTHKQIRISAELIFSETYQLVDFISNDRWYLAEDGTFHSYPFHTPIGEHARIRGMLLPCYGEAAWELPEGLWSYGRFRLKGLRYDLQ